MAIQGVRGAGAIQAVRHRPTRRGAGASGGHVCKLLAGQHGAVGEPHLRHAILGVVAEGGRQYPVQLHLVAGNAVGQEHVASLVPGNTQAGRGDPRPKPQRGGAVGVVARVLVHLQLAVARLEHEGVRTAVALRKIL